MRHKVSGQYLLFVFLFYSLLFNELIEKILPVFGFEDELFAGFAIAIWTIKKIAKKRDRITKVGTAKYVLIFLLIGIAGSLVYRYQEQDFLSATFSDLLLCAKFWMCIYTSMQVFKGMSIKRYAQNLFFHIQIVTWAYLIFTVLNMAFSLFPYYDVRYGIRSSRLFYSHPSVLSSSCAFLIILIIGIRPYIKRPFLYIAILSMVTLSTLRARALANIAVLIMLYYIGTIKKEKFKTKELLFFVPVIIMVGWSQFEYYFISLGTGSARLQLLLKSFPIALDHFPLGTGFATYGSYFSSVYYSPVYYKYGLNTIYGLSKSYSSFIGDSFWPMLIGQFGFLGTLFFIFAIFKLYQCIKQLKRIDLFFYISGLGVFIYLLIDSTGSTAFVHPLSMPMAIWLGVLLSNITKKDDQRHEHKKTRMILH